MAASRTVDALVPIVIKLVKSATAKTSIFRDGKVVGFQCDKFGRGKRGPVHVLQQQFKYTVFGNGIQEDKMWIGGCRM